MLEERLRRCFGTDQDPIHPTRQENQRPECHSGRQHVVQMPYYRTPCDPACQCRTDESPGSVGNEKIKLMAKNGPDQEHRTEKGPKAKPDHVPHAFLAGTVIP